MVSAVGTSWRALVVASLAVALAGCGGGGHPTKQLGAAEPAHAPPLSAKPAGKVIKVGPRAEGVTADPVTGLIAVGVRQPDQLVLVDGRTATVRKRVALPGHLRHLQLAAPGGPVLVPDEDSGLLLTVALPSGTVLSRVDTGGKFPHDATEARGGSIVVANEGGGTVAVIRDGQVIKLFDDTRQPAGAAHVGRRVGIVDVRQDDLHVYDARRLRLLARLPAGRGPTHVVADNRGHFVVADTRGNALLVFAAGPKPRRLGRMPLPGTPYGIAYDPTHDRLWVTLTARNELVGLDFVEGIPHVSVRLPTVRQPNTVAVDPATGRVFVTGTHDGLLQIIEPPS
jgi:DNA-binding beta-propeller fold protein YncE